MINCGSNTYCVLYKKTSGGKYEKQENFNNIALRCSDCSRSGGFGYAQKEQHIKAQFDLCRCNDNLISYKISEKAKTRIFLTDIRNICLSASISVGNIAAFPRAKIHFIMMCC